MSMRFQVGEMAIYAVASCHDMSQYVGQQCTVGSIGPYKPGDFVPHPIYGRPGKVVYGGDYIVTFADGQGTCPKDWQLRKINPPEEPEAMTHHNHIDEEITA